MAHTIGWARRSTKFRATLALGVVVGIGAVGTMAAFSDTAQFTSTFSTGSVDITVNADEGKPTPYAFNAWGKLLMTPGTSSYALMTVNNAGSVPFNYVMTAPTLTGDAALATGATGLQAGIALITGTTCDAAAFAGGTPVATVASLSGLQIATGRPLAVGASENLCFQANLPVGADNAISGLTVTPTFTMTATAS